MTQDKSVTAKCIQEIRVGDTAYAAKTVTEADVMMFAMLSSDYAPQHVSAAFGATMSYHSRIAHGMLTVGLVGPVLNRLCGDASCTAYQKVHFSSAVLLNDTVYVKGTVIRQGCCGLLECCLPQTLHILLQHPLSSSEMFPCQSLQVDASE